MWVLGHVQLPTYSQGADIFSLGFTQNLRLWGRSGYERGGMSNNYHEPPNDQARVVPRACPNSAHLSESISKSGLLPI